MTYTASAAIVVAAVVAGVVLTSTGQARSDKYTAYTQVTKATAGDPMRTITPYQLAWMHLYLSPGPASPRVSASQAVHVLERAGIRDHGGPVLETVLARCSMTPKPTSVRLPWAQLPCWVMSIKPGTIEVSPKSGSDLPTREVKATVEIAMVDANTGKLMFESSGTPTKQAP